MTRLTKASLPSATGLHPAHGASRVCVALAAATPDALFARAEQALAAGEIFLELRLDALRSAAGVAGPVASFTRAHPRATVLATCRTQAGGGGFTGPVQEQMAILAEAARAGARMVDLELETLEAADVRQLRELRVQLDAAGAQVLVSAHDYRQTGDLRETLSRLRTLGQPLAPAVYKVVSTATALADNLRMLQFLGEASAAVPVVGMCMGSAGVVSRALAVRAGAAFTFASAEEGQGTAPGQVSAHTLRLLFRFDALSANTRLYGIAGNPVTHSLSPVLHNAGFRAAGVDAVYLPLHTTSMEDLWSLVQGLPLDGLSVTMPWKTEILARLDATEPEAERLGAVNTVVRRGDGSLFGTNTDALAVVEPIEERVPLPGARVLVAGAGGAARAAIFALRARGAEVAILNRTRAAAEQLAAESQARVAEADEPGEYDIVVNATPAGMAGPHSEALAVPPSALTHARLVFEMVYRPAETPLTRLARSQGIPVISGLEMFLRQGLRQWELWTGRPAPRDAMRAALTEAAIQTPPQTAAEGENHGEV